MIGKVFDVDTKEAIPYARLTLTEKNTKKVTTLFADVNGNYTFDSLLKGKYLLEVEFIGYKKTKLNHIKVRKQKPIMKKIGLKVRALE